GELVVEVKGVGENRRGKVGENRRGKVGENRRGKVGENRRGVGENRRGVGENAPKNPNNFSNKMDIVDEKTVNNIMNHGTLDDQLDLALRYTHGKSVNISKQGLKFLHSVIEYTF